MPIKTNGKTIKVNVNQLVYRELHRPMIQDKSTGRNIPIYSKLDTYKRTREETLDESVPAFKSKEKTHFNSANNIRKVFITHRRIFIEYYTSPGMPGLKIPAETFANLDTDLLTVIPNIMNYEQMLNRYIGELSINPKAKGPDNYILEGNLLGVFNQLYTCSNIEEIYFDWTFLFTQEIQTFLAKNGLGGLTGKNAMAQFLNNAGGVGLVKNNIWLSMFANFAFNAAERPRLAKDQEYFKVKYPRLKVIAMVDKLDDVLDTSRKGKSLTLEVREKDYKTWLDRNMEMLSNSVSSLIVSRTTGTKMESFVIQDNIYIFDKQFKSGWLETYKSALSDIIRQSKYGGNTEQNGGSGTAEDEVSSMEMNEVETRLLQMEQELDSKKFNQVLNVTVTSGFKVNELKSLFRSFTKPNRVRWAKIVGLKLD